MAFKQTAAVQVSRWQGSQHPTISVVTRMMQKEGLRPYMWENTPNRRYGVRSHGYDKVLYVIDGTLELTFPDSNQSVTLRSGDRIDIPAGVRHGTNVGRSGSCCLEAALSSRQ